MFGKITDKLNDIKVLCTRMNDAGPGWVKWARETTAALAEQTVWLELIADTQAEKVADRFEELLKQATKDQKKLAKDDLKQLVHDAVLQSRQ